MTFGQRYSIKCMLVKKNNPSIKIKDTGILRCGICVAPKTKNISIDKCTCGGGEEINKEGKLQTSGVK